MRRKDREITDINEIRDIVEKCKVCHLAMIDDGKPYAVPLNFGYTIDGNTLTLYFHSAKEGRKIDILKKNSTVCFDMLCEGKLGKIIDPCNSGYYFECVMGFGSAEFVDNVEEKCRALSLLVKHQSNQDFEFNEKQAEAVCVFKVSTNDFTGKRKPVPGTH